MSEEERVKMIDQAADMVTGALIELNRVTEVPFDILVMGAMVANVDLMVDTVGPEAAAQFCDTAAARVRAWHTDPLASLAAAIPAGRA